MNNPNGKNIFKENIEGKQCIEIANENVQKLKLLVEDLINENEEMLNKLKEANETLAYVNKKFKNAEEAIQACIEKLEALEGTKISNESVPENHNGNGVNGHNHDVISPKRKAHTFLEVQENDTPPAHFEVELNNPSAVAFWCKNFHATRAEIITAMEVTGSKSWFGLLQYFKKLNKGLKNTTAKDF